MTNKKQLLVVIHAEDESQTLHNSQIAFEKGADGIFLIGHSLHTDELIRIYHKVRANFAEWWIGLNFLRASSVIEAFNWLPLDASGLWTDNAGVSESADGSSISVGAAAYAKEARKQLAWNGLYFGGVAFKTGPPVMYPGRLARMAVPYVDVITTSGPASGTPPKLEKIQQIRDRIGDHLLAIASGITPTNVHPYLPYTNYFLVASGVSFHFSRLDPNLVDQLANIIHR